MHAVEVGHMYACSMPAGEDAHLCLRRSAGTARSASDTGHQCRGPGSGWEGQMGAGGQMSVGGADRRGRGRLVHEEYVGWCGRGRWAWDKIL